MVKYAVDGNRVLVDDVTFGPIEFLDWDCLTVSALGWGKIQISNSNRILLNHGYSRRKWMLSLCEVMLDFYPKEVLKIHERVDRFKTVQSFWEHKKDMWA